MQDWWKATFPKGRQTLTITDASGNPVSIAYGEKGSGKPLFLVHGVGSWSYGWQHNIDSLSKHFRVISFDAKGYGFSEKPTRAEEPGHQVIEMVRIIQALCNEPVIVVAQSLGALVTLAAAQAHPELFAKLILINPAIFPQQLPSAAMRLVSSIPLDLIKTVDRLRLSYLFAPLVWLCIGIGRREVVVNPADITPEEVYWVSYPYVEFAGAIAKLSEDLQHAAIEIKLLGQNQPNLIRNVQANLGAIASPILILWGAEDRWFSAAYGEKLHACLSNSQLKIIPNCGHDCAASCSNEVNLAILKFLFNTDFAELS